MNIHQVVVRIKYLGLPVFSDKSLSSKEKSREKWRVMTDFRKSERGLQQYTGACRGGKRPFHTSIDTLNLTTSGTSPTARSCWLNFYITPISNVPSYKSNQDKSPLVPQSQEGFLTVFM
jgi:hypothetical protein